MPDWDCVQGPGSDYGMGDPDFDHNDPAGHLGGQAFGPLRKRTAMSFFDDHEDEIIYGWQRYGYRGPPRNPPRCKFCGSTDVRWRQQTGRWALFSTTPGVEHNCRSQPASADEFDEVKP